MIQKSADLRVLSDPAEQTKPSMSVLMSPQSQDLTRHLQEQEDEKDDDGDDDDDDEDDDDNDDDDNNDDDDDGFISQEAITTTATAATIESIVSTSAVVEPHDGPSISNSSQNSSDGRTWEWNLGPLCVVGAAAIALIVSLIALKQRKKKQEIPQQRTMGGFTSDVVDFYLRDPELDLSTVATGSTTSLSSKAIGGG
ncbi:unnamed protein product [Cylindrotheca closterium]|uniref:Uncharacterized protein n=1 Tax=Cylindrotheca closterium TaxID=2856 RepID=A0AAD2CS32_9STRA|nr:unnamed protein product [Cylindrotheca closterium]